MHTEPATAAAFWGELAPCDHVVQIYKDDGRFVDTLVQFVGEGLAADEAVIVIATPAHRHALDARLATFGHDIAGLSAQGRYFALDAADTLASFMRDGWPDAALFNQVIGGLVREAQQHGRKVRAFGEMVALMWAQGQQGATVQLEHMWTDLCGSRQLALFCAYPRIGATRDITDAFAEVCDAHTRFAFA